VRLMAAMGHAASAIRFQRLIQKIDGSRKV
jgi:hypothetical protein